VVNPAAEHVQLDVLGAPSRASWDHICRTWRSSEYADEAFMASVVSAASMPGRHTAALHRPN